MQIRLYCAGDELGIWSVFRLAFAGPPWHEDYTIAQVQALWTNHRVKPGFSCLVSDDEGRIVAASWWDCPSLEQLRQERGDELARFAGKQDARTTVWIRETVVDPEYQDRGIGRLIKAGGLQLMKQLARPVLVLTRLRYDNYPIRVINSSLGLSQTGIRIASQRFPGTFHEYWYRLIEPEAEKGGWP